MIEDEETDNESRRPYQVLDETEDYDVRDVEFIISAAEECMTHDHPLHWAIQDDASLEVIKYLVEEAGGKGKGKEWLIEADDNGRYPLHLALEVRASLEVIRYLVEEADTDKGEALLGKADKDGRYPLHVACKYGASLKVIKYLVEDADGGKGKALLGKADKDGKYPHQLALKGDPSDEVFKYLVEAEDGVKGNPRPQPMLFGAPGALPHPSNLDAEVAVEFTRLSLQLESALLQHKLAMQYYDCRSFYFIFLPVTILATLTTIIGFLVTDGKGEKGSASAGEKDPRFWSLMVGILGAVTTLLTTIGKRTNFQSQSDMHRSAVKALEKICLTLEFDRVRYDRTVRDIECSYSSEEEKKNLKSRLGDDLKSHQDNFKGVLDACCDSPVPYKVAQAQAFTLLEQIYCLQSYNQGGRDLRPLMYHYEKLWKEYTFGQCRYFRLWRTPLCFFRLWPFTVPTIKVARKIEEWEEERRNLPEVFEQV